MAYTNEQYIALCEAIAQGALSVKYGDKEVTYRSLNEMLRIKSNMETELGLKSKPKRRIAEFSKSWPR